MEEAKRLPKWVWLFVCICGAPAAFGGLINGAFAVAGILFCLYLVKDPGWTPFVQIFGCTVTSIAVWAGLMIMQAMLEGAGILRP